MPSRPDPVLDDHEGLVRSLRAERPHASAELRERVLGLAAAPEPEARRPRRFSLRPLALAVPALALVLVAGVVLARLDSGSSREGREAVVETQLDRYAPSATATTPALREAAPPAADRGAARPSPGQAPAPLPPSGTRLQDYRAELRIRVPSLAELSRRTARAMRITRSLGGFVVTADLRAPAGGEGDSLLVVRVPVSKVQEAIARFAGLGTIVSQRISLQDLEGTLERQSDAIGSLRRTIATFREALEEPGLSAEERARLRLRLANAERSLAARVRARGATTQAGSLSRIALTLTTRSRVAPPQPKPEDDGYVERRLEDAFSVAGRMLAWLLYALIVAGPLLLLGGLVLVLERRRRRRRDERLLERA